MIAAMGGDGLVAVACDGAGSAARGGAGASIAARVIAASAAAHLNSTGELPDDEAVWSWLDDARDRISAAAGTRGASPRDFAATLVMACATPDGCLLALVGDGVAAVRQAGDWAVPSWPEHGEYASTTFFVTDEPSARLRISRLDRRPDALFVMSDGLERLALDVANRRPHAPFYQLLVGPVERSGAVGRDARLSASLARYLDGEAVNARTDDDKTLVIAVAR